MIKITEKDIRFLYNAVAISITILAVIFAIEPYLDINNKHIDEIVRVEHETIVLSPDQVLSLLKPASHKPVMLVVYASWCGFCHRLMPGLLELMTDNQLDGMEHVFVSLDSQPRLFSKYLVYNGYQKIFTPYRVEQDFFNNLADSLKPTGSTFRGAIPYVGFFNTDGKAVAEILGLVDKQKILQAAAALHQN